jgi:hypothetical protein
MSFLRVKPVISGGVPLSNSCRIAVVPSLLVLCSWFVLPSSMSKAFAVAMEQLQSKCQTHGVGQTTDASSVGSGVVLTDFEKHFLGGTYQGQQDVNISVEAVTSAALVAARALHQIASGGEGATEIKVCYTIPERRLHVNHDTAAFP